MSQCAGALGMRSNNDYRLSPEAAAIGFAAHLNDEQAKTRASVLAVVAVSKIFEEEGWLATKPFHQKVNSLVVRGALPEALARSEKEQRGKQLIVRLSLLALREVLEDGQPCKKCNGNGLEYLRDEKAEIANTNCQRCKGKGFRVTYAIQRLINFQFFTDIADVPAFQAIKETCSNTDCRGGKLLLTTNCSRCAGTGRTNFNKSRRAIEAGIEYETWKATWERRYVVIKSMLIQWLNEFESHALEKC